MTTDAVVGLAFHCDTTVTIVHTTHAERPVGPSDADTTSARWQKRDTQLHNNTSFPTMAAVSSFLSLKTSLAYAKLTLQHVNDVLLTKRKRRKDGQKEGKRTNYVA